MDRRDDRCGRREQVGDQRQGVHRFQHDVCAKDIRLAVREGMHSIEHIKRFTTNGMASDQGKLSSMHGLAIAAEMLGKEIRRSASPPSARLSPVTYGTLIAHSRGGLFARRARRRCISGKKPGARCSRMSATGSVHVVYPRAGETMHQAVSRECKTARDVAGMFDASTLGKIGRRPRCRRVHEPDVHQRLGHAEARQVPLPAS